MASDVVLKEKKSEFLEGKSGNNSLVSPDFVSDLVHDLTSVVSSASDVSVEFDLEKDSDGRTVARFKYRAYKRQGD